MMRPRIKRTTEWMETPDGDLYLLRPSGGTDVHIEKPDPDGRALLESLDGSRERGELEDRFGEEAVRDLLAQLEELGLVEDGADDDLVSDRVMDRFDRQLRYFSDVTTGPTPSQCQSRLESARIVVLGVGGLGGWSALSLACCGVGEMLLIDGDAVEQSNLNRQVLYTESDIGRPKVEAAAERLLAFNSAMRVETVGERVEGERSVAELIDGFDLVVDAADWPAHEIEQWVNSACFAARIPYITMSHFPPIARVGPLYVPGETGCFACQVAAYRRAYPLFDVAVEQRKAKPSPAATLGPACALIGGQVGLDVLHFLTGLAEPSTQGVGHIYDLRTMKVEREQVVPEADCPVCGDLPPHERSPASEQATRSQ
ncbi:MAG TPA: TOMM precursor leader peptide-binding protein [Solirubrobacterales bacterium]|nr:TOMM precursor leader peptide-binding protein [Solirubrobacterales bacterium]